MYLHKQIFTGKAFVGVETHTYRGVQEKTVTTFRISNFYYQEKSVLLRFHFHATPRRFVSLDLYVESKADYNDHAFYIET